MIKTLLAALVAWAGVSAAFGETRIAPGEPTGGGPATEAATRANGFALDLYQQAARQPGNIVFSPSSVQIALSMAAVGAAGDTATEMNKVLGLAGDNPHAAEAALLNSLTGALRDAKFPNPLKISNNLWVSDKFDIKPEYVQALKKDYHSAATPLNFGDAAATAKTINDSVAKDTNDKIKDLVPPDAITPMTRLILTNAVHFKADWVKKFEESGTTDKPFNLSPTEKADVKMMNQTIGAKLFDDDQLQALELPYARRQYSMWVIAPKAIDGIAAVEKRIAELPKWIEGAKGRQVDVTLPKFKFESQFSLPKTLAAMGMATAFSDKANFSGISSSEGLYIGDVIHKAMIDVNENGTEAAAATAVVMRAMSAPVAPQEPVPFVADRPFIVALRHNETGAILFLARIADPRK